MEAFQKDLGRFEELNAQVLGVSPDKLNTHEEFAAKYGLQFPLISDEKGEVQKLYAPGRVTYVIDRSGTVRFIMNGVPDNTVLLGELTKLEKKQE